MFPTINEKLFPGGFKKVPFFPAARVFAKREKVAKSMGVLLKNKPFWNSSADPADLPDLPDPTASAGSGVKKCGSDPPFHARRWSG